MEMKKLLINSKVLIFMLPSFAGLAIFYIIPFVGSLYYAFLPSNAKQGWSFHENFAKLFSNELFLTAIGNTLLFILLIVPIIVLISLCLSMLIWNMGKIGDIFRSVMLSTYVMPVTAVFFLWNILFNSSGPINNLLTFFNMSRINFSSDINIIWSVVILYIWKNMGFNMIIILASLKAIPKNTIECALLDGVGWFKRLFVIIVPQIMPTIVFVLIISTVSSLKIFKEVYVLSGAHPSDRLYTIQHFMYNQFNMLNYNYVVASSIILLVIICLLVGLLFAVEIKYKRN